MNTDQALAILTALVTRVVWEGLVVRPEEHLALDVLHGALCVAPGEGLLVGA